MKQLLLIITVLLMVVSCSSEGKEVVESKQHTLVILDVFQADIQANDGVIKKEWRTLVKLESGARSIMEGKYGAVGDTLFNMEYHTTWDGIDTWSWIGR
jgi:uncharacterized protein YcfL